LSTARDLIKGSLRLIGALASGETPPADELQDGLSALNAMVGSWSTESLSVFYKVREEFTLTASQQSRTIGVGGNFDTARPIKIEAATIEDQSSTSTPEYPLEILTLDQWAAISIKSVQSTLPSRLYYEPEYPLGVLYLWPIPTAANKLVLYSLKSLTSFTSLDTDLSFPPGYERALRYNLAIELVAEYGKSVSGEVGTIAVESKANIQRINIKENLLGMDSALLGGRPYNILMGR
jgi:hypothetical protein